MKSFAKKQVSLLVPLIVFALSRLAAAQETPGDVPSPPAPVTVPPDAAPKPSDAVRDDALRDVGHDVQRQSAGPVERLPLGAYPAPRTRGLYGGSLWLTFHGLQ